jgi:hypothetical protein
MRYVDPLITGWHDIQEVAKTHWLGKSPRRARGYGTACRQLQLP